VNSRKREVLEMLSQADWRALVYRELQADDWYETPETSAAPVLLEGGNEGGVMEMARPLAVSVNGNGHHPVVNE